MSRARLGLALLIVALASGTMAETVKPSPKATAASKPVSRDDAERAARLAEARRKFFETKPDPDQGTIKDFGGYDYKKDGGTMKSGGGFKF